jgi:2-dehydropantoate 2-reductase
MLQDVERGRKTEIETITGAVVREGLRLGVPTPHNQTLLWMIRGLDSDLDRSGSNHTHG